MRPTRHLLADGWRSLWHSPALRRAFCARHLGAGATSLAIHATALAILLSLAPRAVGIGAARPGAAVKRIPTLQIFAQSQSANSNASAQNERPSTKPLMQASKDSGPAKVGLKMEPGNSTLTFSDFSIDVDKLVGRSTALFPFLTRTLTFNVDEEKRKKRKTAALVNPFSAQSLPMPEPPLVLSETEVQRLVDDAWARRERWRPFQRIRTLADEHSPDVGQVPALLRGHANQNALQPYVETKMRDPRVWAQLELVADHELFIDFIAGYVSRHPGTKGSIELLFLLDILAQGSLDTLQALMGIEPDRHLGWTRRMNATAFGAIVQIRDYYVEQRQRRGLETHRALGRHYDQVRTQILTTIVDTAPDDYRVNDARYLLGEIHWKRGRYADAKKVWSQMRPDLEGRYAEACSSVLQALRDSESHRRLTAPPPGTPAWKGDGGYSGIEERTINAILDGEYQRWVTFSRERLRRFGYELDAF